MCNRKQQGDQNQVARYNKITECAFKSSAKLDKVRHFQIDVTAHSRVSDKSQDF